MINTKKAFFAVLIATVLGSFFRLLFIDKAEGLWNDEYVSWSIASMPIGKDFFHGIYAQCHMPLYYFYLKFFIHFFGNGDLTLRLTSVIPGVLSIISMYFVGKEFKDEKLGILCSFFTAISSFLIYFSQEVRFYSLLFFFSTLLLIFTLRILKRIDAISVSGFILSSLLVLFTHTLGFIFVLLNMLFIAVALKKMTIGKNHIIVMFISICLSIMALSPFIFKIIITNDYSQWWGHFTFSKVFYILTDYFSPKLVNIVGAPDSFLESVKPMFFLFGCVPAIICIVGVIKSLTERENKIILLSAVSFLFLLSLIVFSLAGKLVLLTKYSIEIYPTLILLACYGLSSFKKKALGIILILTYSFISLFYLFFSSISAPKIKRNQGHKIVADLINSAKLRNGDFILINYYQKDRFEKYFNFSNYNVIAIGKGNFQEYISDYGVNESIKYGKNLYRRIFSNDQNEIFNQKMNSEIISKMKKNQKIVIIVLNNVAVYSPVQLDLITQDDKKYEAAPYLFMVFSYLKNQELKEFLNTLAITRLEQKGSWSAITFIKR